MPETEEIEALNQFQDDSLLAETGISDNPQEVQEGSEEADGNNKKNHILTTIIMVGSTASIFLQIVAMWLETSIVVYVMGIIAILIAPMVMLRQVRLSKMESIREVHNNLRKEVNRLQGENDVLKDRVNGLQVEVDKVENLENQLSKIARGQNANVNDLVKAVKENGIILKEQAVCAKAAFEEQLFTTVLRTDRNRDYKIDGAEEKYLLMRLKNQEGITLNEEKFHQKMEENQGSVRALMKIIYDIEMEGQGDDPVLQVNMGNILENHRIEFS